MAAKKTDAKSAALAEIETHAQGIRDKLKVPKQNELFRAAVEAGYLAALADGNVDENERDILVRAVEVLSQGAVVEWETESELDACASRATDQGPEARATAVGKALASLGQADVGLYIAALVAREQGDRQEGSRGAQSGGCSSWARCGWREGHREARFGSEIARSTADVRRGQAGVRRWQHTQCPEAQVHAWSP